MGLKRITAFLVLLAAFFWLGWLIGRRNGKNAIETIKPAVLTGFVPAVEVEKGLEEVKPDTVFVPKAGKAEEPPKLVPVNETEPGPERTEAVTAALLDWNTRRIYSGTLFDDPTRGKVTYSFPVQFNKAGQIEYSYEPAPLPVPKQRKRMRLVIGGEYYTNGQYSFGAGVQYGVFGVNARILKPEKTLAGSGYALGVGVQFVF